MNELVLYGSVGSSWWDEDFFTAAQVRAALAAMDSSQPLTVRINSGGGIATEGQAIYTALKDYPGEVTTVVDGVAASAASLIAMAGDVIRMRMGAWMLIHDPAQWMVDGRGTEEDHRRTADLLGVVGDAYAEIYAARAGISREEARAIMRAETVMDGEKAVEMGFATERDGTDAVPAAAFDYRIYANAPAALRQASERLGAIPAKAAVMAMFAGGARITRKEPEMADKTPAAPEVTPAPIPTTPTPDASAITAQAVTAERERVRRITAAAKMAGLPDMADELIAEGVSFETAQDRITAAWAKKGGDDLPRPGAPTARILRDERETKRTGIEAALVAQLGRSEPTAPEAQPYMGMSIVEMAADYMGRRAPLRTAADRIDVIEMSTHSTSDFPLVLENALNKRLQDTYAKAVPTYASVAERMDFTDFRPHPVSNIGDYPQMQLIREGGEIQFGTVGEKRETLTLLSYASGVSISRQMLINDDLSAIDRILSNRGTMVALFEDQVFWSMFLSGTLADGPTLVETGRQVFNTNAADNTKAGAATAITIAALAAARASLRTKRGLPSAAGRTDGQLLNLQAAVLLVGPQKETEAQQLVAPIQAQQAGNVNPFSGTLRIVVTPYITDNAWYVLADPSVLANFAYGFLRGENGPRMRMEEPFGVQGMRFTVEHDFGCGAIDFRAGWKNPGA